MHNSIEIDGVIYDSTMCLREQFGIGANTPMRWHKRGLLPSPVRLGVRKYFRRDKIAELLTRQQAE